MNEAKQIESHLVRENGQTISLSAPIIRVGSDPGCEIFFPDPGIAPFHATLFRSQGQISVCDLRSSTGVSVNGVRVVQTVLSDGDSIDFGPVRTSYSLGSSPPPIQPIDPQVSRNASGRAATCSLALLAFILLLFLVPRETGGGHTNANAGLGGGGGAQSAGSGSSLGNEAGLEGDDEHRAPTDSEGALQAAAESIDPPVVNENGSASPEAVPPKPPLPPPPVDKNIRISSSGTTGQPGGQGGNIFEAEGEGSRFVYVAHRSSSMRGERFRVACEQLKAALSNLDHDMDFAVIFYNSRHEMMPHPGLIKATPENVKDISRWVDAQSAAGNTKPVEPVEAAFQLRPDTVFLLSDGEFPNTVPGAIRAANRSGIVINTVALHNPSSSLERIAEANRGTYRFVPR